MHTGSNHGLIRLLGAHAAHDYFKRLAEIDHQGVVCAIFFLRKSASEYYWLNVVSDDISFSGVIEHTNLIDPKEYGGRHIVYVFNYVHWDSEFFMKSAEEIIGIYKKDLLKVFPHLVPDDVLDVRLSREAFANTIYTLNYSTEMPAHETPIEGLYLCNMSQIYPHDRNVSNSVRLGKAVAERILERCRAQSSD